MPSWSDRRLARRVQPGDGRSLKPFRWWQMLRRSVLSISLPVGGVGVLHSVEVLHGGDPNTGEVMARLYRDGRLVGQSRVPARFPVEGGVIEARTSEAGMRRCAFVADDGTERHLVPDPASAEGRRMRFAQQNPGISRVVGAVSIFLVLIGVGLNLLQIAEPVSRIPAIADTLGTIESPMNLPIWLNIALGLLAALGAIERALRLRYHWLLDGGAGN